MPTAAESKPQEALTAVQQPDRRPDAAQSPLVMAKYQASGHFHVRSSPACQV